MSGTGAAWRLKGAAPWAAWHSMTFSLCIAQLNFVVGDLSGNVRRIVAAAHEAHAAGASPRQMGDAIGVSHTTVHRWIKA